MSTLTQYEVNRAEAYVDTWFQNDPAVIALFQKESLLAEAYDLVRNFTDDATNLSVISLGRGAGPEIDSILAIANNSVTPPTVKANGLVVPGQINPMATIHTARAGSYPLLDGEYTSPGLDALRDLGFSIGEREDKETGELVPVVDARLVRNGHEVTFHDENPQFEPFPPSLEPANLVTCNGLLRYLSASRLVPTIETLYELTEEGGILALGVGGMSTEGRSIHSNMGQGSKSAVYEFVTDALGMERQKTQGTEDVATAPVQFYRKPFTS